MPEPPSRTPDRDNHVDASRSFTRAFFGSVVEARDASPKRLKRNRMTQPIHLIQFRNSGNRACCALLDGNTARPNAEGDSTYDLATRAINSRRQLQRHLPKACRKRSRTRFCSVSVGPDCGQRAFQGSSSSIRLILWSAMRARVSASQAWGSTPLSFAVSISV